MRGGHGGRGGRTFHGTSIQPRTVATATNTSDAPSWICTTMIAEKMGWCDSRASALFTPNIAEACRGAERGKGASGAGRG